MGRWTKSALAAGILLVAGALSFHSVCDLYFDCGCVPLWAGGIEHCNVHDPGPDCPWCVGGLGRLSWVTGTMVAGILGGTALGAKLSERFFVALVLGLTGYGIGSFVASWLAAAVDDYPTWLW